MPQIQVFLEDSQVSHDLTEEKITVGRLADNTIQIDADSVSSHHAELTLEGETYHLHDLGSTNGTFVNNEQVSDAILRAGDEVRFGTIETVYIGAEEEGSSAPRPESHAAPVQMASQSARPENFSSTSPVPKSVKGKDPIAAVLYAVGGIAVIAFAAAAYFVATLSV